MKSKLIISLILMLAWITTNGQIEKISETQYSFTSDTFETFGYKTDGKGNFYLYGWQHNNAFIQKHDQHGNVLWTINDTTLVEIIQSNYSTSKITDLAFDKEKNVIIYGIMSLEAWGNPHYDNFSFSAKIDQNGNIVWKKTFVVDTYTWDGLTQWNTSCKIATSPFDSTSYLTFSTIGDNYACPGLPTLHDLEIGLIKIDHLGKIIWAKLFTGNSAFCSKDYVSELELSKGRLIITGFSEARIKDNFQTFSLLLDTAGSELARRMEKNFFTNKISNTKRIGDYLLSAYELTDSSNQNLKNIKGLLYHDTITSPVYRYSLPSYTIKNYGNAQFDDSLNTYIAASVNSNGTTRALLLKINAIGEKTGELLLEDSVTSSHLNINGKREPLIFNDASQNQDTTSNFAKADKQGFIEWNMALTGTVTILHSIIDDSCNIYLVGQNKNTKQLYYYKYRDTTCLNDPNNLQIAGITKETIGFNWKSNDTVDYRTGFFIERGMDGVNFNLIDSVDWNTTSYVDSGLNSNTTYYYRVIAHNAFGRSSYSNIVTGTTLINSVEGMLLPGNYRYYPNPTHDYLFTESDQPIEHIEIYAVTGRLLKHFFNESEIHIGDLPPGVYYLKINQTFTGKLIKL